MPSLKNRPMAALDMSDRVRFIKKIKIGPENECWPWIAAVSDVGYGIFKLRNPGGLSDDWDMFLSNRAAYFFFYGYDPGDECVLHTCDNPPCCNPYHLFLGSLDDNNKDRARKMRTAGTRLHSEDISTIIGLDKSGVEWKKIYGLFPSVSPRTVRDVIHGKTWAWLRK